MRHYRFVLGFSLLFMYAKLQQDHAMFIRGIQQAKHGTAQHSIARHHSIKQQQSMPPQHSMTQLGSASLLTVLLA